MLFSFADKPAGYWWAHNYPRTVLCPFCGRGAVALRGGAFAHAMSPGTWRDVCEVIRAAPIFVSAAPSPEAAQLNGISRQLLTAAHRGLQLKPRNAVKLARSIGGLPFAFRSKRARSMTTEREALAVSDV